MKRLSLVLSFCVILLSGCWDRVEMEELGIITGIAIDQMDDGNIQVSAQLFIPRAITSGETGEDPSVGNSFVREGIGESMAQAISKLQANVPRRLFWAQNKVYIFSEELATSHGIRDEIDYLARHPAPRSVAFLYVGEGVARQYLELVPPLERFTGEALRKLTSEEEGMGTTFRDVDMALIGESQSVSMPYIALLNSPEETRKPHETVPVIKGTALFNKDKMVGLLDEQHTRGLLWLKDKIQKSTVSIIPEGEDGQITVTPTLGKVNYTPEIKGDTWKLKLKVDMEGDIVQNETHLNLMNDSILNEVKNKLEEKLKNRISETIDILQSEYRVDVAEFGRRFHEKYPQEWKEVKHQWNDQKFPEIEIEIDVAATINNPGYIGPPAALPRDEVEE